MNIKKGKMDADKTKNLNWEKLDCVNYEKQHISMILSRSTRVTLTKKKTVNMNLDIT